MSAVIAVELGAGRVLLIDEGDRDVLAAHKWRADFARGGRYYACASSGYGCTLRLHRLLMSPPDGLVVDHINGDGLDNRRANLRVVSQRQNSMNSRASGRTGYRGVFKNRHRFRASIYPYQGKHKPLHLGTFGTPEEAARAYDKAARNYYGEFARLNFPEEAA